MFLFQLSAEMEESKQAKGPPHITCNIFIGAIFYKFLYNNNFLLFLNLGPLKIAAALKEMLAVGFKDVRGMLTRLLEWNEGDIHRVVDVLNVNDHYILFKTLYKGNKVIPFHVSLPSLWFLLSQVNFSNFFFRYLALPVSN